MSMCFSDVQQQTLRAALDRIIPADEFPGAWDTGCGEYILGQLNGQLAHLVPAYHAGLDGLEAEAQLRFGRGFSSLAPDQQDSLLMRIEAGDIETTWSAPPKVFFTALVSHAADGYYADPGQGGNRNRVSWQMLGFNGR